MADLLWLENYSGETLDQLLEMEGRYRLDSLVAALEQALDDKEVRVGAAGLTAEERVVLAVEAMEREVNNGGYDQFFRNSSSQFAAILVDALERIGCPKTLESARKAVDTLGLKKLTPEAIEKEMAEEDEARDNALNRCDDLYYASGEDVSALLFKWVKKNRQAITLLPAEPVPPAEPQ